jgi:hypothetical protein
VIRITPTVTEAVAVTAEATTEAAKQKDDKDNYEHKSERPGLNALVDPDDLSSPILRLIFMLPLRERPYYFFSIERAALEARYKSPMFERFRFQSQLHSGVVSNIDQSVGVANEYSSRYRRPPVTPFGD